MGDALAMVLLVEKGFREEDFASLHPGGGIGKRLLRVESLMHTGVAVPSVRTTTPMHAVVAEISAKGLGMTCVVAEDGRLAGIITDGDLRRHMAMEGLLAQPASAVMTAGPRTIGRSLLAVEALAMMEQRKITSLVVGGRRCTGRRRAAPPRPLAHADVLMESYAPFLAGLVALLVGLAAGKAWERYKLQEGRWIDRRRARESPHYILGLNSMVAGQLDRAIGELAEAARLQPDALEIELILGNLYREKGQVGRAITIHQQLLQRPKLTRLEHAYILLCLGLDYKRGGFVDRAARGVQ